MSLSMSTKELWHVTGDVTGIETPEPDLENANASKQFL